MLPKLTLTLCAVTLLCHLLALLGSGQNPIVAPISELSRAPFGLAHTVGLAAFGLAHMALAFALGRYDRGRLWPVARALLLVAGAGLIYVSWYFGAAPAVAPGPARSDLPLWIVASLTGLAMGGLQPGLSRRSRQLGIFTTVCLGIWLWMVPVFFFVEDTWLGAYQRFVGAIYVAWVAVIAAGLAQRRSPQQARR